MKPYGRRSSCSLPEVLALASPCNRADTGHPDRRPSGQIGQNDTFRLRVAKTLPASARRTSSCKPFCAKELREQGCRRGGVDRRGSDWHGRCFFGSVGRAETAISGRPRKWPPTRSLI